jgi:hypothetical protein
MFMHNVERVEPSFYTGHAYQDVVTPCANVYANLGGRV